MQAVSSVCKLSAERCAISACHKPSVMIRKKADTEIVSQCNAELDFVREQGQSFLSEENIARIALAYRSWSDQPGFVRVAGVDEILANGASLNLPLFVSTKGVTTVARASVRELVATWRELTSGLPNAAEEALEALRARA